MTARWPAALGWTIVNVLQGICTLLWSALWISVALLLSALTWRRGPSLTLARRVWAPGLLAIAVDLTVVGAEKVDFKQPYLLVSNHQSWIDIPCLFAAVPVSLLFMAKRELARVPFLGWYIRAMGMVFVERKTRGKGVASISQAALRLRQGWSVLSFPEGTRSRDGRVHTFKSAGFAAAIEAGVPVLPVALVGAGRVIPPGGFKVRYGPVTAVFGTPLPTAGLALADRADLARRAEAAVAGLLAANS